MNKRDFIKSIGLGIVSIPQVICGDMFSVTEPDGPKIENDWYFDILTPEEISKHFIYIKDPPNIKNDFDYDRNMKKFGWYKYAILWNTKPIIDNNLKVMVIEKIKLYGFKSLHYVRYEKMNDRFYFYFGTILGKK